jgi:MFS family permease
MSRRLVDPVLLPRALALRQTGSQVMTMAGGPLGGLLVAAAGLAGASALDAVSFGAVLAVLIVIRERAEGGAGEPDGDSVRPGPSRCRPARRARPRPRSILREAVDGVRVTAADPMLRLALLLTSAAAGFLLPTGSLLVPLLARSHHWPADAAGLVIGGQSLGIIAVAMCVVRWGRFRRPGLVAAISLFVVASGTAALALAPSPMLAVVAAVGVGAGSGLLTTHLGPLLLGGTPAAYLSRVQSLVSLVQALSLLVMNNVLGNLAQADGPAACLAISAGALAVTGVFGLSSKALRHANPKLDPVA